MKAFSLKAWRQSIRSAAQPGGCCCVLLTFTRFCNMSLSDWNDLNCGNSWPHKHNLYLLPPYEFIYFPKIKTKWMFYKSKRIKSSSWNHLNVNKKTTLNGGLAKSWTCWTLLFLSKSLTLMSCFHITASSYCAGLVSISYPRTSIHFRVVLLLLSYLDFLLLRSWLLFLFFV